MHLEQTIRRPPVVISGPSGVGKGTLCNKHLEKHHNLFTTTVSHTTRSARPGEVDGQHCRFVSRNEFESLIAVNAFIEYTEYSGNYYGTSKKTVVDQSAQGKIAILDIDMGAVQALGKNGDVLASSSQASFSRKPRFVFIRPVSLSVLEQRLRGRATDSEEAIQARLARAHDEMAFAEEGGLYDCTIVNDDLAMAFDELEKFIFDERRGW